LRRRAPYSLPQQAAAAVVQQVSSVVIKQVISAAALNLPCRTRKRWPPDNQPRGSRRTAMTVWHVRERDGRAICAWPQIRSVRVYCQGDDDALRVSGPRGRTGGEPGRGPDWV